MTLPSFFSFSASQLTAIIENVPGYLYLKNIKSFYMGCNINFAKLVGLNSTAEIIGKSDKQLPGANGQSNELTTNDEEVINSGIGHAGIRKLSIKRSDGNYIFVKREIFPFKDENGKIQGIIGIAIDITDEKLLEQQLAKQKQT